MTLSDVKEKVAEKVELPWLYPNPADKIAVIKLSQLMAGVKEIEIRSAIGVSCMIIQANTGDIEKVLPLENLQPGCYVVTLKKADGGIIKSSGLIIQH